MILSPRPAGRVLGIDPGTAVMGYGVVESGAPGQLPRLIECGVIRTSPRHPLPARLRTLHEGLAELFVRHEPDILAVEDIFYGTNVRTTAVLGHARGVILLAGALADIPVYEYPPATIKKAIVGRGAALKPQVGFMVAKLLGLRAAPKPSDAADGVAVALTYLLGTRVPSATGEIAERGSMTNTRGPDGPKGAPMIAIVSGVLAGRDGDAVLIQTDGGLGYEISVPLGVLERLPAQGARCSLYTELVVREDGWTLFGFDRRPDRLVFQRLLGASGFGPRLALALMSSLGPDRTVRAVRGKDIAALSTVPGIGRKKAERLILELSDKFEDIPIAAGEVVRGSPAAEAARALGSLGYPAAQADDAVREAVAADGDADSPTLIKRALRILTTPKGGR